MTETLRAAAPLTFDTPESAGGRRRGWIIGSLSLLAHLLIVWMLSFPSPPPSTTPVTVIPATLFTPPSPAVPAPSDARPVSHTATPDTANYRAEASDNPAPATAADAQQPAASETVTPTLSETRASPVETEADTRPTPPSQRQTNASATTRIDPRAALDAYMSATQQQAILADGADADRQFGRRGRALDTSFSQNTLSQQAADGPTPTRVNCSSGLNQTLAMLSGFAGGTLRCSEKPDLAPYLERRLNAHTDK